MLEIMSTQELLDMEDPEWLIDEMVAENSTTMVYGPWGLGKSFMVLDMVLSATHLPEWLGGRAIKRPLKTLYVVAEGAAWWSKRLLAYKYAKGEFDQDMVLWYPKPVNLWTPGKDKGDIPALKETLEKHEPDIVVFDTWVRCTAAFGMNEDKATDTAITLRNLDEIRDEFGVTPIIVHHPTKLGKFRGSGNLGASVERIISLEEVKDQPSLVDVNDEKGNHIQPFDTFRLRFESVDIGGGDTSAVLRHDGMVTSKDKNTPNWQRLWQMSSTIDAWPYTFGELEDIAQSQCNIPFGSVSASIKMAVTKGAFIKNEDGTYDKA